jgi:hypothetical protein
VCPRGVKEMAESVGGVRRGAGAFLDPVYLGGALPHSFFSLQ